MPDDDRPQTAATQPTQERDVMDQLKLAGAIVASIALALFFLQNLQEVEINFLWFDWNTQMIWALVVSAVLGGVGVFLSMWFGQRQAQRRKERKG
jgi:uncharacterized integral membrane protein